MCVILWYCQFTVKPCIISHLQILLEHFQKVTPWLRNDSKLSSKMANFFPASLATVQNCGALLPLRHPVEVERSDPLTHCYLTCEPVMGEGESAGVHIEAGRSQSCTSHFECPSVFNVDTGNAL